MEQCNSTGSKESKQPKIRETLIFETKKICQGPDEDTLRYKTCSCTHCNFNEGPVRIQYKCLVSNYVFPEMNLLGLVISKTDTVLNVRSFNFHIHVSVSDLYIPRIGLPILLQPNMQTCPGNI
jgi:hypothetical protein